MIHQMDYECCYCFGVTGKNYFAVFIVACCQYNKNLHAYKISRKDNVDKEAIDHVAEVGVRTDNSSSYNEPSIYRACAC